MNMTVPAGAKVLPAATVFTLFAILSCIQIYSSPRNSPDYGPNTPPPATTAMLDLNLTTSNIKKSKRIIQNGPDYLDGKSCREWLNSTVNVSQSDFRIQIIAAAPGSGSDWSLVAIALLTGFCTESVYNLKELHDISEQPSLPFYYKTHFPFLPSIGSADDFINLNPERVVVLIRDPFDAGFSEYIRMTLWMVNPKHPKYDSLDKIITRQHFLKGNSTGSGKELPSAELLDHTKRYLYNWKKFHEYWLRDYRGSVKVMLYEDLVEDIQRFTEITSYFGYSLDGNVRRKQRLNCFLRNVHQTSLQKRPSAAEIDVAKELVRPHFAYATRSAKAHVEQLYQQKYKTKLLIP